MRTGQAEGGISFPVTERRSSPPHAYARQMTGCYFLRSRHFSVFSPRSAIAPCPAKIALDLSSLTYVPCSLRLAFCGLTSFN